MPIITIISRSPSFHILDPSITAKYVTVLGNLSISGLVYRAVTSQEPFHRSPFVGRNLGVFPTQAGASTILRAP